LKGPSKKLDKFNEQLPVISNSARFLCLAREEEIKVSIIEFSALIGK